MTMFNCFLGAVRRALGSNNNSTVRQSASIYKIDDDET